MVNKETVTSSPATAPGPSLGGGEPVREHEELRAIIRQEIAAALCSLPSVHAATDAPSEGKYFTCYHPMLRIIHSGGGVIHNGSS